MKNSGSRWWAKSWAVRLAALALGAAAGMALADPIVDAGVTEDEIKSDLVQLLAGSFPPVPGALRNLGPEARVEFVRAAGQMALGYAKTDDFRGRYAAWRDQHAPKLELISDDDMKERNDRARADYEKSAADQKSMVANIEAQRDTYKKAGLSDTQIDQIVDQARQAQKQIADLQASGQLPTGPTLMTEADRQQENERRQREYDEVKGKFESQHPADPGMLLRRKLGEFLAVSATVDFGAKLDGRRFADPAEEAQSDQWKRCFRAGKPAIDAARALAQEWMKSP